MKTTGEGEMRKRIGTIIRSFFWIFGLLLILAIIKEMMTSPSSDRDDSGTSELPQQSASELSRPATQPQETVSEICGHYRKFHNNRAAYQAAQDRAKIYECAVLQTQLVTWQQYNEGDPRATARIDAAKKKARALLEKHYPKIPDVCANALLAIGYIVISAENPTTRASCPRAEIADEQDH